MDSAQTNTNEVEKYVTTEKWNADIEIYENT